MPLTGFVDDHPAAAASDASDPAPTKVQVADADRATPRAQ